MSYLEKINKAEIKRKERRNPNLPKQIRPLGRSPLTEGQVNILMASLIDAMNEGYTNKSMIELIKDYYLKTCKKDLALSSYYEIIGRAKKLWLTNHNLPSLENYRKEQLHKSELLEDELKSLSKRDIVEKAHEIVNNWKYRDNIVGLNSDNGISINIGVSTNPEQIINSLEIPDEIDKDVQ